MNGEQCNEMQHKNVSTLCPQQNKNLTTGFAQLSKQTNPSISSATAIIKTTYSKYNKVTERDIEGKTKCCWQGSEAAHIELPRPTSTH